VLCIASTDIKPEKNTMAITRKLAAGVLLAAVAGVIPPTTAYAAPEVPNGAYWTANSIGETFTWYFTPCGPDCTTANSPDDDTMRNREFRLINGRWISSGRWQYVCPNDGSTFPTDLTYTFDAATLAGESHLTMITGGCGKPAGWFWTERIRLNKIG
jgi:hypothetical protein